MVLGYFSGKNGPPLCLSAQPKCKIQKRKGNVIKVKTAIFQSVSFRGHVVRGFSENRRDTDSPELLGFGS